MRSRTNRWSGRVKDKVPKFILRRTSRSAQPLGRNMSLNLSDAISHYHSVADATHRFWAYIQFVAAGAATIAWTVTSTTPIRPLLTAAFVVFALGNLRLVLSSQKQMNAIARCISA